MASLQNQWSAEETWRDEELWWDCRHHALTIRGKKIYIYILSIYLSIYISKLGYFNLQGYNELVAHEVPRPPALSQLSRPCVWLSVTVLVEKDSVSELGCADSVLECAAAKLLQSLAQWEWPVLSQQQDRPSTGLHNWLLSANNLLICSLWPQFGNKAWHLIFT